MKKYILLEGTGNIARAVDYIYDENKQQIPSSYETKEEAETTAQELNKQLGTNKFFVKGANAW